MNKKWLLTSATDKKSSPNEEMETDVNSFLLPYAIPHIRELASQPHTPIIKTSLDSLVKFTFNSRNTIHKAYKSSKNMC